MRATQSVFAGSWLATSEVVRGTPVITVRPNAVSRRAGAGATPSVETVDVAFSDAARGARITERYAQAVHRAGRT